jgi:hypothetical protein
MAVQIFLISTILGEPDRRGDGGAGRDRRLEPMSGRARLPGGEKRKASQRHSRRAAPAPTAIEPSWRPGDKVLWRGYIGSFLHDVDDIQAEIMIGQRRYLVRRTDLQPA